MSESKAKAATKQSKTDPIILVSPLSRREALLRSLRLSRRRLVMLLTALLLLVIAIASVAIYQAHHRPVTLPADIDRDISSTDQMYVPTLLKQEYGINPNKVSNADLDKKLTTFKAAHDVGQGLFRLSKNELALHAYQIAEAKSTSSGQTSVSFYIEMFRVAYTLHQKSIGDQAYQKALKIANNSGAEDYQKQGPINSINDTRDYLLQEYHL